MAHRWAGADPEGSSRPNNREVTTDTTIPPTILQTADQASSEGEEPIPNKDAAAAPAGRRTKPSSRSKYATPVVTCTVGGGRLQHFTKFWENITTDSRILDMVRGMKIELNDRPQQARQPKPLAMSQTEKLAIDNEIQKLLRKKAIEKIPRPGKSAYVNNIFARPKPDGSHRVICNLKHFNQFVWYEKFKMDSLQSMLKMIRPNDFMGKVDLSDAFLSVPVSPQHRKYLVFKWRDVWYQYTCMCFGLSSAPRKFMKLMKVLITKLRKQKVNIGVYIDDSFMPERSFETCVQSLNHTATTYTEAGFIPNQNKSVTHPTTEIEILGFVANSETMTVTLSNSKIAEITNMCQELIDTPSTNIRHLCVVIGKIISTWPAVPLGKTQYRQLEKEKLHALNKNAWSFEVELTLSEKATAQLRWWVQALPMASAPLRRLQIDMTIQTDTSKKG